MPLPARVGLLRDALGDAEPARWLQEIRDLSRAAGPVTALQEDCLFLHPRLPMRAARRENVLPQAGFDHEGRLPPNTGDPVL